MENRFPLDILCIPKNEVKEWHDKFHPVESPLKSLEIKEEIKESYFDVIRKYSGTFAGDILLVKVKLYFEYTQLLLALRYLQLLKKKRVIYSKNSVIFKGIIENGIPYRNSLPYTTFIQPNIFRRIGQRGRNMLRSMRDNNSLLYYFRSYKNGMRIVTTDWSQLATEYIRLLNCTACMTYEIDWSFIPRPVKFPGHVNDELDNACKEIIKRICEIAAKFSIILEDKVISFLKNITMAHLVQSGKDLYAIEKKFAKIAPWHILGGTQAGYFNRLIGLVNIKYGGKLSGFNHGNDVARIRDYRMELSIANEFVTYTGESVRLINACKKIFTPLNNNNPEIVSMETNLFHNLWKRERQAPIPPKIQKVMLVSSFYKIDGNLGSGYNDLMDLDIEIRLVQILSKAGYDVLYKAHPGALNKWINFKDYLGNNVFIVREPFEEVMNLADAILFYFSGTTTFTWALCSNKPVIFIDCEFGCRISDEAYALIKKRCRVVHGGLDGINRYSFDEEELLEALARKPEESNIEFIEKYMFPKGIKIHKDN